MLITELKAKEALSALVCGKVFIINCHGCKEIRFPEHEAEAFQQELVASGVVTGIITVVTDNAEAQACIKCGRCVDVCPMELKPLYFYKYAGAQDWNGMKSENVMDCMECRCCEYICSAKLPLVSMIKMGKNAVRGMK